MMISVYYIRYNHAVILGILSITHSKIELITIPAVLGGYLIGAKVEHMEIGRAHGDRSGKWR